MGIVTAGDLRFIKGAVESIVKQVGRAAEVRWESATSSLFQAGTAQRLLWNDTVLGWVGLCDGKFQQQLSLDAACGMAEINVDALTNMLIEVRRADPYSAFPAVERDLNFIVDESLVWADLQSVCASTAGPFLKSVEYRETYRDTKKDGADKKRILLSLQFQSMERTLTGDEVDTAVAQVIQACGNKFSASYSADSDFFEDFFAAFGFDSFLAVAFLAVVPVADLVLDLVEAFFEELAFLAGAFFAAFFFGFLLPPASARAASRAKAASKVSVAGSASLGKLAFVSPSVTYAP